MTHSCTHCDKQAEWTWNGTPICQRCIETLDLYCFRPIREFEPILKPNIEFLQRQVAYLLTQLDKYNHPLADGLAAEFGWEYWADIDKAAEELPQYIPRFQKPAEEAL